MPQSAQIASRSHRGEGIDELQVRLFPNDRGSIERLARVLEQPR